MTAPQQDGAVDRIRYNVLCETLTDQEFAALLPALTERHVPAGAEILTEDTDDQRLYLLASGRVSITRAAADGSRIRLAVLHPGDFFGELELIDSRPRSATVTAIDPCTVYTLAQGDFDSLLGTHHDFTRRLLQVVSIRLRAVNNQIVNEVSRCRQLSRQEISKLQQLVAASMYLNSTLDLDTVLDRILDTALRIVGGDRGTVYLLDAGRQELWSRVLRVTERLEIRLPVGKGIAGYVAATGDTLNIPDAYLDPRFNPDVDRQSGYHTQTILCMPMRNHAGKTTGVFQLLNKKEGLFTEEDEHLLDALSVHAAVAVENARLYEEEKEKRKIEKSLHAAREVQRSILPQALPAIPGVEFAASMDPAEEVGGDLYDFLPLENGTVAFCLGDVSGKGLPASLLMANMQATVRAATEPSVSAAGCIRKTNRALCESTASDKFVTAFYGIVNPAANTLTFANAGQEPPLLAQADGTVEPLTAGGIMLGVSPDFPFEEETVPFPPGTTLVVFTDGVTEALNAQGEMFGAERVRDVVARHHKRPAAELRAAILDALHAFVGETRQSDDITVLVAARR